MTIHDPAASGSDLDLPAWVPDCIRHYIAHTELGLPIRAMARATDMHPSTILRQVRRIEGRRDDPLVDDGLRALAGLLGDDPGVDMPDETQVSAESLRVLRRLCESGATLAVARDMDRGVVVRDGPDGEPARTALVERPIAQTLALRDYMLPDEPGARIVRYRVTPAGRTALRDLMAQAENAAQSRHGLAEARAGFAHAPAGRARPVARFSAGESPLASLARRRDKDGKPFLPRDLVIAGERLREDYELAQMAPRSAEDWTGYLTGAPLPESRKGDAAAEARARVAAALRDLGPGLGDVVLRCCCYLEGMEETERSMGWAARSGKIVLRIALQRLRRHYEESGLLSPMIG